MRSGRIVRGCIACPDRVCSLALSGLRTEYGKLVDRPLLERNVCVGATHAFIGHESLLRETFLMVTAQDLLAGR